MIKNEKTEKGVDSTGKYVWQLLLGISVVFSALLFQAKSEISYLRSENAAKDKFIKELMHNKDAYILLRAEIDTKKKIIDNDSNQVIK